MKFLIIWRIYTDNNENIFFSWVLFSEFKYYEVINGTYFDKLSMCLENKNSFDIKQNWTVRDRKRNKMCVCVSVLAVGYTCDEVEIPIFYIIFLFSLGAGESGKSTIVKQMK